MATHKILERISDKIFFFSKKIEIIAYSFLFCLSFQGSYAQIDSLIGFNRKEAQKHAAYALDKTQSESILKASERAYIRHTFFRTKPNPVIATSNKVDQKSFNNCDNIGFEKNSVEGWNVQGDYEIVSSGVDSFGGFTKVFPGAGEHSLRLNNNTVEGKTNFLASISRTIQVTPQQSFFNLHFAMVILNYPHDSSAAARFRVNLLDANGQVTLCPQFNCYYEINRGAVGVTNFSTSPIKGVNTVNQSWDVSYAKWQTVGINLSDFMNQTITIQISCDWCIYLVDWAYCYLDADCNTPVVSSPICAHFPYALSGTPGMGNYLWSLPNNSQPISGTNIFTVNAPGIYTMQCNQSKLCNQLPFTYLYSIQEKPDASFSFLNQACDLNVNLKMNNQASVDFSKASYYWYGTELATVMNQKNLSYHYPTRGNKIVELVAIHNNGCKDTARNSFKLSAAPDFRVELLSKSSVLSTDLNSIQYEAINNNSYSSLNYKWIGPTNQYNGAMVDLTVPGEYLVIARDEVGPCLDTIKVYVSLPLDIPNVFTPNGDGVNDAFAGKIYNTNDFHASIYDRWGNLIIDLRNDEGDLFWDGKTKEGVNCAEGVFFYTINYINQKGETVALEGDVTLLR